MLSITSLISSSIREVGELLFAKEICLSSLIQSVNLNLYLDISVINLFSLEGIIKSFITVGLLTLSISYSIRYILIEVFLITAPFAALSLLLPSTSWIFKTWIKMFFSLLLVQIIVPVILIISFASCNITDSLSKLIFIGSIFCLNKVNSFIKEFMGGFSTNVNLGVTNYLMWGGKK